MSIPRKRSPTIASITDSSTFHLHTHPAFVQAVNRAANLKCLEAIRTGKLRPVVPANKSLGPIRYSPRMDLIDDPSSSTLTAVFEIPGIKTNDISLHIRDGSLIVQGERKNPYPETAIIATAPLNESMDVENSSSFKVPVQELRFGSFYRSIRVPSGIKESDVSATLHEGMLTVTWPRSPASTATSRPTASDPSTSITSAAAPAKQ